jgi:hypothetical protein
VCHHDEISVGILHEDFSLTSLPVADLAPDITRASVERPARGSERILNRFDVRDVDLRRLRIFGQQDKLRADRSKGRETWA